MRAGALLLLSAAILSLAAADRRLDQDFEFDDAPDVLSAGGAGGAAAVRRPRRYTYDPHNPLCRTLVCKKREVCLLRDSYTALCATKKDVLRRGDVIVAETSGASERGGGAGDDDDVFYETAARGRARGEGRGAGRCAGCGGAARAAFLCGSDNRTYSSLCRLDLHNCVRRARPPVRLACRGFCPCPPPARPRRPEACALDEMADRLLDWFSVLLEEAGGAAPPAAGWPRGCRPEVRWMFAHLDAGGDGALSAADLWALRHDERERCLRPFLASCGDAGAPLTRASWCGCLRRALRPCAALARAHPAPQPGAYVPSCDARGFYRARQCHSALGVCWCVDPHGVELAGSRTKGAPRCPGDADDGDESPNSADELPIGVDEEGAGGGLDDEDAGGSGDAELRF